MNRLTSSTGTIGTNNSVSNSYTYKTNGGNQTGRIDSVTYNKTIGGVTSQLYPALSYDYDSNGNITKVYEGSTEKIRYHYDELNRLVREDNLYLSATYVYCYDVNGDILSKDSYYYTTDSNILGSPYDTVSYSYTDSNWKNGVTQFGNDTISYDANGNPTSYRGKSMTWDRNRLMSSTDNDYTVTYSYDENGLRTEKYNRYERFGYFYSGDRLVKMESSYRSVKLYYGADGRPYAIDYNGTVYYYILNLQGDILGIYDVSGNIVVTYLYDTWGRPLSIGGLFSSTVGQYNPLRYRGYVYDNETKLYYLQSRYYDP